MPSSLGDAEAQQEVRLIEAAEHVQPRVFGRARDGAEIDMRGDVGLAWLLQHVRQSASACLNDVSVPVACEPP